MKYLFLSFSLFLCLPIYAMQQQISFMDKILKKDNEYKWPRIPINRDNEKRRKWAYFCEVCS